MSFVKFTLGDIRTSVRRKLDDSTFDTATIDEAANDFQFELFNDNRIRFMEASTVLAFAQGDYFKTLPSDFMNIISFIVIDGATTYRDLTKAYLSYQDFMLRYANFSVAAQNQIRNWTFFGEGIRIQNPSDAAKNVNVDYMRSPALMVNAGDYCELPINARELMTLGTLQRIMRVNEDYAESDAEVEHLQGLRTAFIKNYGRGGAKVGGQVIQTGRGAARGGYRADRDF